MKKIVCLLFLIGPLASWSQSGDLPVKANNTPVQATPTLPAYQIPADKYDTPLDKAKNSLTLKPEQMVLWQAFEDRVNALNQLFYLENPVKSAVSDPASRQIGRLVVRLQNRLAALEDVETAAKNLFVSLSPEQQQTANLMLLSTIPRLNEDASKVSPASEVRQSKDAKSDAGGHKRRSGGMAGLGSSNF